MTESEVLHSIEGPSFEIQLTPVDQRSAVVYPRTMLCFQLPKDHSQDAILGILKSASQRLVNQIPWLASTLGPNPDASARAKDPFVVGPGTLDLMVRRRIPDLIFSRLTSTDFKDDLWPARPPPRFYGCSIQANFIEGNGCLLGFGINHALADGFTIVDIIRRFAAECVALQTNPAESLPEPQLLPNCCDRTAFSRTAPADPIPELPGMIVLPAAPAAPGPPPSNATTPPKSIDKLFRLPPAGLQKFKQTTEANSKPLISTHDILCAQIWQCIMRARLASGVITPDATVSFGMPVDLRRFLPAPYLGCAIAGIYASLPLSELLGGSAIALDPHAGVRAGALAIRTAISSLSAASIPSLRTLHSSVPDLRQLRIRGATELSRTHCFLTSWYKFAVCNFEWGDVFGGRASAFRTPRGGLLDGFCTISPRPSDGAYEVQVCLAEGVMGAFEGDETWRALGSLL